MQLRSKLFFLIPVMILATLSQSFTLHHQESSLKNDTISTRTMSDSESRIIADIKKVCLLLSSESSTLSSVISEFGTPIKEIPAIKISKQKIYNSETPHEDYDVKPFNDDLDRAYIDGRTTVFFHTKQDINISVNPLEEVFGDYYISMSRSMFNDSLTKNFTYKPVNSRQDYEVSVYHNNDSTGRIVWIRISEKLVVN
jgi:hypothetical protein